MSGRAFLLSIALTSAAAAQQTAPDGLAPLPAQSLRAPLQDELDLDREQREAAFAAAERGLAWLAGEQGSHGEFQGDVGNKRMDSYIVVRSAAQNRARGEGHVGLSAIAGMAFLAGGHLPDRGRYGKTVRGVIDYLVEHTGEAGYITDGGTNMYSHAFATLFLAQVHGLQREQRIRTALERASRLIVDCQNAQGGWRYYAFTSEADLSVTVCQLQALRAAYNIGIQVDRGVMDRAVAYVKRSRTEQGRSTGLFYYKIQGRGSRDRNRDYAINAAAVTSLFSAGVYDEELYGPALDFVAEEYSYIADFYADHFFFWYGSYYAIQALHHAGGERYRRFAARLDADLLRMQQSDGRWIDRVGPGDEFSTAIACLILALPWQQLPIFQR